MIPYCSIASSELFASVAGGLVGGLFTYLGVMLSVHHDRQKISAAEDGEVLAFCKAIRAEIKSVRSSYLASVGSALGEHRQSEPFLGIYPVFEEYFTVFNTNAQMLGKLKDDKLRSAIVEVYSKAKGHLDSLRHNNHLIERYAEFHTRSFHSASEYDSKQRDRYAGQLVRYAGALVQNHAELVIAFDDLLAELNRIT